MESWAYNTLTWNNMPSYTNYAVVNPEVSDNQFINADVTQQVQSMIDSKTNYGFVMKQFNETVQGSWDIRMTEYSTVAQRPYLTVSYYDTTTGDIVLGDNEKFVKWDKSENVLLCANLQSPDYVYTTTGYKLSATGGFEINTGSFTNISIQQAMMIYGILMGD